MRGKKIILFIGIVLLLTLSFASAKSFTIFNSSNESQPYFSVNGTTGNVGIGITSPTTLLQILNDNWISAKNALRTGVVNMFKVNTNDQIEVGATLNIGNFEFFEDSGLVTFVDMPVSSTPSAGTPESYVFKVDGNNVMTVYSEADGDGGVQNKRVGIGIVNPFEKLHVNGSILANGTITATTDVCIQDGACLSALVAGGITWANVMNGTVALNNGTWALMSILNNGTYVTTNKLVNGTLAQLSVLNNGTYVTTNKLVNGTLAQLSVLNNGTYVTTNKLVNGTLAQLSVLNNGTYANYPWNATNSSYMLNTGDDATGNYNFTTGNITIDSENRICLNYGCTQWVMGNSSGVFIQG